MLEIRALSKSFSEADKSVCVLDDLDLVLEPGETAALLGESGSGKTTLLNLISGLDQPDGGEILVDSESTQQFSDAAWNELRRTKLGLVFQQYHLVPTLNVEDNLKLQARLAGKLDQTLFERLAGKLGLNDMLGRLPHQLSGGQQQRVAIGRALMHQPKLVLADEPTGNLDETTSEQVMELLLEVVSSSGSALLMVTHSHHMASFLQHRLQLSGGRISRSSS
jgi:putative ABC transport system ATP-binding protein